MTANPPATTVPALKQPSDIGSLELSHREQQIHDVLEHCFNVDREIARLATWLDHELGYIPEGDGLGHFESEMQVVKPVRISDAFVVSHHVHADLATMLYGAVSRLVDQQCLFDDEWSFEHWSRLKQDKITRQLFDEAGISDRFVEGDRPR